MRSTIRLRQLILQRTAAILPLALLVAACETLPPTQQSSQQTSTSQQDTAEQATLRTLVAYQDRLYRVAAPLLVNNAELCKGNARNLLGFTAKNKYSYTTSLSNAAQTVLGLDERLQVTGVLAGSGAARAGLRRGDKLIAIEDKTVPEGANAERQVAGILAPLIKSRSSIQLTVLRNGANTALDIPLTRACAYSIELGNVDNVVAYNDGYRVLVTRGMMNFARTDEELAYVVAKEMAHNSLGHASKQNMKGTIGSIIDNLVRLQPDTTALAGTGGMRPMPQELDVAADTLSLYMLTRAGYAIDNAPRFWERLASQYPPTALNGYTAIHPATGYRLTAMRRTIADVKSKQAGRKPLSP